MRPDGMMQADTPAMDGIMRQGTFSLNAKTVFPSMTLPCITSLFRSVPPERHGTLTNTWVPQVRPVPSLFDVLHYAGKIAGSFYSWEQLRDLSSPGSLTFSLMMRNKDFLNDHVDWTLTQTALHWLTTATFDFAFIYLGDTDVIGHDEGWMSKPYLSAIQEADRCIAHVMEVLPEETSYIVLADHGGHLRMHGTQMDEDMVIPVLAQGPDVARGKDLGDTCSILDVAPSVLEMLNIDRPKDWMGTPLLVESSAGGS